ncbi:tetratricopeptide repeat protein [Bernardetia sp.]|uniref:tetratricopeptide repeat protein n=1 Tax=Bernardetia sp. TaxID=1937974 RepID=UPI0025C6808E|nr:tetratricopeptide repeat protein [Bernardetia sp.]
MKRYEIIIISLFVFSVVLQFFEVNESSLSSFLILTNTILALSYFIGGYLLLNNQEKTNTTFSVLGGFAFGIALFAFWTRIIVTQSTIIYYFPLANVLFFTVLLTYLFLNRSDTDFVKSNKPILIRSFAILIITCFFFYIPIEYAPYNNLIRAMNVSRPALQHNLNMAKYHEKAKIALDAENYEKAVEYSQKSEIEGRKGFKLPDKPLLLENGEVNTTFLKTLDLKNMTGIYLRLYVVYTRLAHYQLENNEENQAFQNYKIAHQILNIYNLNEGQWEQQNIISFANMGKALSYLNQFEQANQYFNQVISLIDTLENIEDVKKMTAYEIIAESLYKQGFHEESNFYYLASIKLKKDSLNVDTRTSLAECYMKIGRNYAQLSKTDEALDAYKKVFYYEDDPTQDTYVTTSVFYGSLHFQRNQFQKADSIISESIKMYEAIGEKGLVNIGTCKNLLAKINIQLGNYEIAEKYITEAIKISKETNTNYIGSLSTYASLNYILSNYKIAEKQYEEVFRLSKAQDENSYRTLQLMIQLANTKVMLSKLEEAERYALLANEKVTASNGGMSLDTDNLGNELAYLNYLVGNYTLSREFYQVVIRIDQKYQTTNDLTTGVALNGLGLLEMYNKNYDSADILFNDAFQIHKAIFNTSNSSLATLHSNRANLYILMKDYQKVEQHLKIATKMNEELFDKNHINFANLATTYGDLEEARGNTEKAIEYYQKALEIYLKKFDKEHFKVLFAEERLNSIL